MPPIPADGALIPLGVGLLVVGIEDVVARTALARFHAVARRRTVAREILVAGAVSQVVGALCIVIGVLAVITASLPPTVGFAAASVACASSLLRLVRRRASDGADRMMIVAALLLAAVQALDGGPWAVAASVTVAVVIGWSYLDSAIAKLRVPAWRRGRAFALVLNLPSTGDERLARLLLDRRGAATVASWTVMGLESLALPAFLIGGTTVVVVALLLVAMHVGIAVVMGLNRFLWAFGAALFLVVSVRAG